MATSTVKADRTLIWENPNHTAGISSGTEISVDTSKYKYFEIEVTFLNALDSNCVTLKCGQGRKLGASILTVDTSTTGYAAINYACRQIDCGATDPNKIVIGAGYMFFQGSLYSGWDARCVPQYIYGIK